MRSAPTLDRIEGTLLGQCLGDALGFVVEGFPPEECAAYADDVLRAGRAGAIGRPPFPFGQYTDDSQLARELLLSLVESSGFDPVDYGRRIAALFTEERVVGRGRATEEAAHRLARGWPWWEAGTPAPAAGNGGAMRAAPAGIWHFADVAQAASLGNVQSSLTHLDRRACAGGAAIAAATALALRDGPVDPRASCAAIAEQVAPLHAGFAHAIADLGGWSAHASAPQALERIAAATRDCGGDDQDGWRGISPFVVPSVLWSLHAFLRSPDDPWETLCTAIEVGGDVDTTAAMAGALAGARCGAAALPAGLLARLQDRGSWREPALRELAARAHRMLVNRGR